MTIEDVTVAELFDEDKERLSFPGQVREGGGVPPGIACAGLFTLL